MPPKSMVPPENTIAVTHTDLTLEREKIELERERLSLERERLSAERDRWKLESELTPASSGRLTIAPATLVLAALLCCVVGAVVGFSMLKGQPPTPSTPDNSELELRSLTATNAAGEVRSVFYVQTVDTSSRRSPSRLILE